MKLFHIYEYEVITIPLEIKNGKVNYIYYSGAYWDIISGSLDNWDDDKIIEPDEVSESELHLLIKTIFNQ